MSNPDNQGAVTNLAVTLTGIMLVAILSIFGSIVMIQNGKIESLDDKISDIDKAMAVAESERVSEHKNFRLEFDTLRKEVDKNK